MTISHCYLIVIAEDQTPRFLDIPQDTEILAGEPVRFQCRVDGEPFPTVAFYRVRLHFRCGQLDPNKLLFFF